MSSKYCSFKTLLFALSDTNLSWLALLLAEGGRPLPPSRCSTADKRGQEERDLERGKNGAGGL